MKVRTKRMVIFFLIALIVTAGFALSSYAKQAKTDNPATTKKITPGSTVVKPSSFRHVSYRISGRVAAEKMAKCSAEER